MKNVAKGEKRRKLSFIFGGITGGVFLLLDIICWMSFPNPLFILISLYPVVAMYTFVSCCILNNNFVGELFLEILTWNIKLPGLIFTWDIDGCMWFIAMKILFIVIGFCLTVLLCIFALFIGSFVSIFVYPFAIVKNIRRPEDSGQLFL